MRRNRLWRYGLAAVVGVSLMASAKPQPQREYITHTVKRGETVSLICIRHYGHYTAELGKAVKRANPDINDINVIEVGQKLRLRRPLSAQAAAQAPLPASEVELFEKKVNATQGVVTYLEGDATLQRGEQPRRALKANTVVFPGDVIETGAAGRAEIIINRESVVRLNHNTRVTIEAFRDNKGKKGTTRVQSALGTLWTRVKSFKDRICRFELELPTAIAGVHGTVYQTRVAADKSTEVKVYDGEVSVKGKPTHAGPTPSGAGEVPGPQEVPGPHEVPMEEWVRIVRSMQRIVVDTNGTPAETGKFSKDKNDEWVHFNEERDRHIAEIVAKL